MIIIYNFDVISIYHSERRSATSYSTLSDIIIEILEEINIDLNEENKLYHYGDDLQHIYEKSVGLLRKIKKRNDTRNLLIPVKAVLICNSEEKNSYFSDINRVINRIGNKRQGIIMTSSVYRNIKINRKEDRFKELNIFIPEKSTNEYTFIKNKENINLIKIYIEKDNSEKTIFSGKDVVFYQNTRYLCIILPKSLQELETILLSENIDFIIVDYSIVLIDEEIISINTLLKKYKQYVQFYCMKSGTDISYNNDLNMLGGNTYLILVRLFEDFYSKYNFILSKECARLLSYDIDKRERSLLDIGYYDYEYISGIYTDGEIFIGFGNKNVDNVNYISKEYDEINSKLDHIIQLVNTDIKSKTDMQKNLFSGFGNLGDLFSGRTSEDIVPDFSSEEDLNIFENNIIQSDSSSEDISEAKNSGNNIWDALRNLESNKEDKLSESSSESFDDEIDTDDFKEEEKDNFELMDIISKSMEKFSKK